jgi:hypothetical protein
MRLILPTACVCLIRRACSCVPLTDVKQPDVVGTPIIVPVTISLGDVALAAWLFQPFSSRQSSSSAFSAAAPSLFANSGAAVRLLVTQGEHQTLSDDFTINTPVSYTFDPPLAAGERFVVEGTFGSENGPQQLGAPLQLAMRDVGILQYVWVSPSYAARVNDRATLTIARDGGVGSQRVPIVFRTSGLNGLAGAFCDGRECLVTSNPYPNWEEKVACVTVRTRPLSAFLCWIKYFVFFSSNRPPIYRLISETLDYYGDYVMAKLVCQMTLCRHLCRCCSLQSLHCCRSSSAAARQHQKNNIKNKKHCTSTNFPTHNKNMNEKNFKLAGFLF